MVAAGWQYLPGQAAMPQVIRSELPIHARCRFPIAKLFGRKNPIGEGAPFTINANDPLAKILLPFLQIWALLA